MILSLSAIFWILSVYLVWGTKLVKETLQAVGFVDLVSGLTMCSWDQRTNRVRKAFLEDWRSLEDGEFEFAF